MGVEGVEGEAGPNAEFLLMSSPSSSSPASWPSSSTIPSTQAPANIEVSPSNGRISSIIGIKYNLARLQSSEVFGEVCPVSSQTSNSQLLISTFKSSFLQTRINLNLQKIYEKLLREHFYHRSGLYYVFNKQSYSQPCGKVGISYLKC